MSSIGLFTQKEIYKVLKSVFSCSDESEISFSIEEYNEYFRVLNVKSNNIERSFFLVKVSKNLKIDKQLQNNFKVLRPVFIIEDNNKDSYGAFECQNGMELFVLPEQNNKECLKIILENLAEQQALDLINRSENEIKKDSEYNLKSIYDPVLSMDIFTDLKTEVIKHSIEDLQLEVNRLLNGSYLLVRSIGCPFGKNVYINQELKKSIFFVTHSPKIVPPAYDALLYIFALSTEKFRQEHFEELVLYYFESLNSFLQKLPTNVTHQISRREREHQVKVLLPVVKFKIANSLLKLETTLKLKEILNNILCFLKYPLINQEDIYEATRNNIGSSNYDLLNYSLKGLSEINGHLGQYFHLSIQIKTPEEEKELQLFAKIIKPPTEMFQTVVEKGPARKEDFFYSTLIPFYSRYGLDDLLDFAPKCYLSRVNWLIILDDLSKQGYVGFKPNVVLNYDGLKVTLESLAKFHACTIILEEMLSEETGKPFKIDEKYGEFLGDSFMVYNDDNPLKPMLDSTLEMLYYIVEKLPEITEKLNLSKEEIRTRLENSFISIFTKIKKSEKIRNIIQHGDMYISNMLFKLDEARLFKKQMLIDFQMLQYGPPTYDLLVFLFENSTKETRDKYFKILIEDYYQFITENIRKFNFDPEKVFPRKSFDRNVNFMMSAGAIGAFMYVHQLHIDPDFREEAVHDEEKFDYYFVQHKEELVDIAWKSEHYRNMLKGLVEDIVDIIQNEI